jgi:hypothetical protein
MVATTFTADLVPSIGPLADRFLPSDTTLDRTIGLATVTVTANIKDPRAMTTTGFS